MSKNIGIQSQINDLKLLVAEQDEMINKLKTIIYKWSENKELTDYEYGIIGFITQEKSNAIPD